MVEHLVYMDLEYPFIRLYCACNRWDVRVPVVAGEQGLDAAVEAHRREVFGDVV